jgi:hypothetical protein
MGLKEKKMEKRSRKENSNIRNPNRCLGEGLIRNRRSALKRCLKPWRWRVEK